MGRRIQNDGGSSKLDIARRKVQSGKFMMRCKLSHWHKVHTGHCHSMDGTATTDQSHQGDYKVQGRIWSWGRMRGSSKDAAYADWQWWGDIREQRKQEWLTKTGHLFIVQSWFVGVPVAQKKMLSDPSGMLRCEMSQWQHVWPASLSTILLVRNDWHSEILHDMVE